MSYKEKSGILGLKIEFPKPTSVIRTKAQAGFRMCGSQAQYFNHSAIELTDLSI